MKDKKLLIVERCNSNLQIIEEQLEGQDKKSIVLTGLFTTFGTKNRNGRIYESADFIPHVEALKVKWIIHIHLKLLFQMYLMLWKVWNMILNKMQL